MTADDFLRQSATDVIKLLTTPPSTTTLSLQAGDETRNGLLQLAELLNRSEKIPNLIPPLSKPPPPKMLNKPPFQRVLKNHQHILPPQRVENPLIDKIKSVFPQKTPPTIKIEDGNELNYPFPNAAITFALIMAQNSKA